MAEFRIACIVEGPGDSKAVPVLLHRLWTRAEVPHVLVTPQPFIVKRNKVVNPGELEKIVEVAAGKVGSQGGVFIVLDADDDCPKQLGPSLLERAIRARSDVPVALVLANREFEAWFLATAESLGISGFASPADPDAIRGAKERIRQVRTYSEQVDQQVLTREFDLHLAERRSRSFRKCVKEFHKLIAPLLSSPP